MTEDIRAFGALLRARRRAAGLSQQDLADRSGLSIRAISNLERGRTRWPYRDSLLRLAESLGLGGVGREEFLTAGRRPPGGPEAADALGGHLDEPRPPPTPPRPPPSSRPANVPRHLPADVPGFIGRSGSALAALSRAFPAAGQTRASR